MPGTWHEHSPASDPKQTYETLVNIEKNANIISTGMRDNSL